MLAGRFVGLGRAQQLSLIVCIIGSILLVGDLVFLILTFRPSLALPHTVVQPFFLGMFPIFGWALIVTVFRPRPRDRSFPHRSIGSPEFLSDIPGSVLSVVLVVAATAAVIFATTPFPTGQPEYDSATHTYRMIVNGAPQTVDRAQYATVLDVSDRLFLSAAAIFLSVAVLMTLGHYRASSRS